MDIIILRFDAPLMSFGGVMVDQHGVIDRFPGQSFLAGLFGNALGYRHGDTDMLNRLQERIESAARWDIAPERIIDYQTVDLGQEKMKYGGWTTRGEPEHRSGGADAKFGTHQRYRHYWANGVLTVAVSLPGEDGPCLKDLVRALMEPARPLFLGRKACLPSAPIVLTVVQDEDVLAALRKVPPEVRGGKDEVVAMEACWPARLGVKDERSRRVRIHDQRDWRTQLHTGSRTRIEGILEVCRK